MATRQLAVSSSGQQVQQVGTEGEDLMPGSATLKAGP